MLEEGLEEEWVDKEEESSTVVMLVSVVAGETTSDDDNDDDGGDDSGSEVDMLLGKEWGEGGGGGRGREEQAAREGNACQTVGEQRKKEATLDLDAFGLCSLLVLSPSFSLPRSLSLSWYSPATPFDYSSTTSSLTNTLHPLTHSPTGEMRLITHNLLQCHVKSCTSDNFPLQFQDVELLLSGITERDGQEDHDDHHDDDHKRDGQPQRQDSMEDDDDDSGDSGSDSDSSGDSFDPQFLRSFLPKLEWDALYRTCLELGITSLPAEMPVQCADDLVLLKELHRILFEVGASLCESVRVCSNSL